MKNKALKRVLLTVSVFLGIVIVVVGCFLIFESATTLQVQDTEAMAISGKAYEKPDQGREMVCNLYEQSASLIRRALIH